MHYDAAGNAQSGKSFFDGGKKSQAPQSWLIIRSDSTLSSLSMATSMSLHHRAARVIAVIAHRRLFHGQKRRLRGYIFTHLVRKLRRLWLDCQ